ncbi:MAG: hypothetical protein O0X93_03180, partial [Methanocorpusculum sp.]|nr:hypothetical protein [Methanocorpusculum sp.]
SVFSVVTPSKTTAKDSQTPLHPWLLQARPPQTKTGTNPPEHFFSGTISEKTPGNTTKIFRSFFSGKNSHNSLQKTRKKRKQRAELTARHHQTRLPPPHPA